MCVCFFCSGAAVVKRTVLASGCHLGVKFELVLVPPPQPLLPLPPSSPSFCFIYLPGTSKYLFRPIFDLFIHSFAGIYDSFFLLLFLLIYFFAFVLFLIFACSPYCFSPG